MITRAASLGFCRSRGSLGLLLALCAGGAVSPAGCTSVEIVRLQPDILHTPRGTEPLAAIQVTTMGFFFLTLGLPEADLDQAVNELLIKEAKKIGADKLINLRFDVTPSHGVWFLTKLLWFRVATAWGIAVVSEPPDDEGAARADQAGGPASASGSRLAPAPAPAPASPTSAPATSAPAPPPAGR